MLILTHTVLKNVNEAYNRFKLPKGALWSAFVLLWTLLFINGVNSEGRIVCYYTNWSVYRPGTAKFNPQNINPYLCTHLIYAFGGFTKDNQMKPFDKYQDIEQGGYAKFTGLKTYNKQLKTMIAIGGWNEASSRFSPLVANPERRQKFIKNILKFLRQNHFDGIDLDWEYPAHREGGKPGDRDNYAQFVQELRAEFERESEKTGRQRLLLTMAVPAGIEYIEKGYDIPKLNKYLDWFNVLTYDFHSSHEPSVNHHAPLYPLEEDSEYNYDAELNIDYSIKYYLKAGADRNKLVLGIPTYGRSYTLINEESTEIGAPAEGPGEQGDATREKGYLAFYEICNNIKEDPDWEVVQPNINAMGPYAYRRTQWVGYDDEAIVRKKAQYVVEHGLGGIMFWSIDNDDFRGTCTGKPYPLIEAAKESMFDAMGLGINEVSKSSAPRKSNRSRNHENSIATRNRINIGDKLTYEERKESSRRTSNQESRKRLQHSTTRAPSSTTIRLTEAEGSSLYIGGRTTTPPPPTTPDPGTDFKCEDEGFYQHPRDCKKYYWCLDSGPSGLGIVAHQFTCPSGLYFNPAADSCDFARNVPCKTKKSTTAAPVTKSYAGTSVATTAKPTASVNRITAATARTTFFRTTSTTAHTTTTTTAKPPVEEEDYMDVEEQHSEEDPKVIKELIELIRRVGGIEELEKHLLRKDDGTISFKQHSSSSSNYAESTTSSSISKSLYDKVLSRPNALNSFRNRFTPSNSYRKTEQFDREKSDEESEMANENDTNNSKSTSEYSKYSSVVRGNSRQGPQNEGLDKLPEFSGFLKERKQYVTINRNRGSQKKIERVESDEEEIAATIRSEQITDKPFSAATPSYTSIRRTRPSTTASLIEEEDFKDTTITKPHASLSRMHTTDASSEQADVNEDLALVKYKYLERARSNAEDSQADKLNENKKNGEQDGDITHQKEDQKITVQLSAAKADYSTQQLQEQVTTIPVTQRTYVSLGRRTTTTASNTETSTPVVLVTTTPTETSTAAPNNIENLTYQPLIALTTTIATTTTNLPATITNTSPSITIIPSITSDLLSSSKVLKQEYQLSQSTLPDSPTPDSTATTLTTEYNLHAIKHETDSPAIAVTTEKFSTPTIPGLTDNKDEVNLVIRDQNQSTVYNKIMRDTTPVITNTFTTTTEKYTSFTNRNNTDSLSSPNTAYKYFGGKREKDQQKVLSRSSLKQTTELYPLTTTITNESINNEFLGSVSSPRPFGYPKRRGRPTVSSTTTVATEVTSVKTQTKERPSFVQKAKLNAAVTPPTKVSSNIDHLSQNYEMNPLGKELHNHDLSTTIRSLDYLQYSSKENKEKQILGDAIVEQEIDLELDNGKEHLKYQFNRSRFLTTTLHPITTGVATTSTTTTEKYATKESQDSAHVASVKVNYLVDVEQTREIKEYNRESSTIIIPESTTPETLSSPAPTLRRIKILRHRRPLAGLTNNSYLPENVISARITNTTTTANIETQNSNILSTVRQADEKLETKDIKYLTKTHNNINETETFSLNTVTPPKRFRKIIRKIIKPMNLTNRPTIETIKTTTETASTVKLTSIEPTILLSAGKKQNSSRHDYNRNIKIPAYQTKSNFDGKEDNNENALNVNKKNETLFAGKANKLNIQSANQTLKAVQLDKYKNKASSVQSPKETSLFDDDDDDDNDDDNDDDHDDHDDDDDDDSYDETSDDEQEENEYENVSDNVKDKTVNNREEEMQNKEDTEVEEDLQTTNDDDDIINLELEKATYTPLTPHTHELEVTENNQDTERDTKSRIENKSTDFTKEFPSDIPKAQLLNQNDHTGSNYENIHKDKNSEKISKPPSQLNSTVRKTVSKSLNVPNIGQNGSQNDDSELKKQVKDTKAEGETPTVQTLPETIRNSGEPEEQISVKTKIYSEERTAIQSNDASNIENETVSAKPAVRNEDNLDLYERNDRKLIDAQILTSPEIDLTSEILQTTKRNLIPETTIAPPSVRPTFRRKVIIKKPSLSVLPYSNSPSPSTAKVPTSDSTKKYTRPNGGRFVPHNANNRKSAQNYVKTDSRTPPTFSISRLKAQDTLKIIPNEEYSRGSGDGAEEIIAKRKNLEEHEEVVSVLRPAIVKQFPLSKKINNNSSKINKQLESIEEDDDYDEGEIEDEDDEDEEDEEEDNEEEEEIESNRGTENSHNYLEKSFSLNQSTADKLPIATRPGGNIPFNSRVSNTANRNESKNSYKNHSVETRAKSRSRVVNRPQGVAVPNLTIKPIALDFERTTVPVPTKPAPFVPSYTPSYERKYTGPSTEATALIDNINPLIEDLNIEALNARNKKIFDINSKKHTTLKPKLLIPTVKFSNQTNLESALESQVPNTVQNTAYEVHESYSIGQQSDGGFATTTTPKTLENTMGTNTEDKQHEYHINHDVNANEIFSQDHDNYLGLTTTQPPSTTLLHVFTLSDDEQSTRPSNSGADPIPRLIFERVRPKHKVIEINRVVEIHSKEEKLRRKSKANQIVPIGGPSPLKVESLPHVEQLGEISVVKYVHLVDGSDIKVEGHSTVTDYTPTESIIQKSSMPVRNSLPEDRESIDGILNQNDQYSPETSVIIRVSTSQESPPNIIQKRQGKALVPEVIREAVETSTISLEGLFENARKAKVSNTIDGTQKPIHINSQNNDAKIAVSSISTDSPEASGEKNMNISSNVPLIAWLSGSNGERQEIAVLKNSSTLPLKNNDTEQKSTLSSQFIQEDSTTIGPNLGNFKVSTVPTTLFPTYVRPIVPLLRPESNESSPLVISIANLDKVILSKVKKTDSPALLTNNLHSSIVNPSLLSKSPQNVRLSNSFVTTNNDKTLDSSSISDDSRGASSNRLVSYVKPSINPAKHPNLTEKKSKPDTPTEMYTILEGSSVGSTTTSALGSKISEIISFSTETHVIRKKRPRKFNSQST
uniref:chitinase n=1 Tax=Glossina austeni TaxID=7395 RepID=A0A1A9USX4_GLOAU